MSMIASTVYADMTDYCRQLTHEARMEPSDRQLCDDTYDALIFGSHCRIANREVLIAMIVSESRRTASDCQFIFDNDYHFGLGS